MLIVEVCTVDVEPGFSSITDSRVCCTVTLQRRFINLEMCDQKSVVVYSLSSPCSYHTEETETETKILNKIKLIMSANFPNRNCYSTIIKEKVHKQIEVWKKPHEFRSFCVTHWNCVSDSVKNPGSQANDLALLPVSHIDSLLPSVGKLSSHL